jgi:hypothetical protein
MVQSLLIYCGRACVARVGLAFTLTGDIWRLDACAADPTAWLWYQLNDGKSTNTYAFYFHTTVILGSQMILFGGAQTTFHMATGTNTNTAGPKTSRCLPQPTVSTDCSV